MSKRHSEAIDLQIREEDLRCAVIQERLKGAIPANFAKQYMLNTSKIRTILNEAFITPAVSINYGNSRLDPKDIPLIVRHLTDDISHPALPPGGESFDQSNNFNIMDLAGFRPYPNDSEDRQAQKMLAVYLCQNGMSSAADLVQAVRSGYVGLDMPKDIFLALHFALVGRGVYLDRKRIRRKEQGRVVQMAPSRDELIHFGATILSNPSKPVAVLPQTERVRSCQLS